MYDVLQVLGEIGGIASSLLVGFGAFATVVNYYVYVMHFMHLLYFIRDDSDEEGSNEIAESMMKSFRSVSGAKK